MSYADRHLLITYKDQPFRYYPGRATPPLARECRKVLGMGPAQLWQTIWSNPPFEVDQAASLLWLARQQMAHETGVPSIAMTLEQIDDLLTADDAAGRMTIEFIDFDAPRDAPEIAAATESTPAEDGGMEVAPDPEG